MTAHRAWERYLFQTAYSWQTNVTTPTLSVEAACIARVTRTTFLNCSGVRRCAPTSCASSSNRRLCLFAVSTYRTDWADCV